MAQRFGDLNGRKALVLDGLTARQKTLRQSIACTGVGVHSGAKVNLKLNPAPAGHGIVFHRTDRMNGAALIPARWDRVVDTRLCTTLGNDHGTTVSTVEHLLSAFAGQGVDNALVEVDGPELPIMDGSAEPFVFLIECAGTVEQEAPRRAVEVLRPVRAGTGDAWASLEPARGMTLSFEIEFANKVVSRQRLSCLIDNASYKSEISRARTFGFEHEVEQLRKMGLARGGSLDNAVVIGKDRILNEGGLRFPDEFVRHKLLDAVGDLYLAGAPVLGHFHGHRSGHATNNELLKALFADAANWRLVDMTEDMLADPLARGGRAAYAARA